MKFACINRTDENSKRVEKDLIKKMEEEGHIFDEINPDVVFSIGGDGTFLKVVNRFLR